MKISGKKELFTSRLIPWRILNWLNYHFHPLYMILLYGHTNLNTVKYWDKRWFTGDYGDIEPERMSLFIKVASKIPHDSFVLDVGCGDGSFMELLRSSYRIKSFGIDFSPLAIQALEKKGLKGKVASATRIALNDNSFDVVTAIEILEHLSKNTCNKAMKEMSRLCRDNGMMIFTLPRSRSLIPQIENEHMRSYTDLEIRTFIKEYLVETNIEASEDGFYYIVYGRNKKVIPKPMILRLKQCMGFCELALKVDSFTLIRVKETLKDFLRFENKNKEINLALDSTMAWLSVAQDATDSGGIAEAFSLFDGWKMPYPEVSGYIISTFLDYYKLKGDKEYLNRAERIADWEVSIVNSDGSIKGGQVDTKRGPIVFNTAQVLLGMCDIYKHFQKSHYHSFIKKASDWIVAKQEESGDWVKYEFNNISHTYNTRTCWALLKAYELLKDEKLKNAAIKALDLYLLRRTENGWYSGNSFKDEDPFLHTIAYATSGFVECGIILNEAKYIDSARKSAVVLLDLFMKDGYLSGQYNENWQPGNIKDPYYPAFKYRCLTGEAQMSIIWSELYNITKEEKYKIAAYKINEKLMQTQIYNPKDKRIHGAIKGSMPIYGVYMRYSFPSWGAKFFADALILEGELLK